jgi:hypothetical protein
MRITPGHAGGNSNPCSGALRSNSQIPTDVISEELEELQQSGSRARRASNASAQRQALSSDGKDDVDCFPDFKGLVREVLD